MIYRFFYFAYQNHVMFVMILMVAFLPKTEHFRRTFLFLGFNGSSSVIKDAWGLEDILV